MPVRATKRGAERTRFASDAATDVLICGASFAGLAVARELRASGASVLVLDRYEIGERQTSACAAPTEWLVNLGLEGSIRQTFGSLLVHTPSVTARWPLPWTFSTFDYRTLCRLLWEQTSAQFETAKVDGRTGNVVHTDRGDVRARVVVDALGWRRVLASGANFQPPDAPLSRGLEVHPDGHGADLELWLDRRYVSPGYGWSFPARDELRIGVGSFDAQVHVKDPTLTLAADVSADAVRFQGNWIPHRLRPATEDGVFFVGDSAGHCLPMTAEGIRTALYFGVACGRELAAVLDGRQELGAALRRYAEFSASHRIPFECMYAAQQSVRRLHGAPMNALVRLFGRRRVSQWAFRHYLDIAPPSAALPAPASARGAVAAAA
jgi:flavin-dependent dehydrogenase